MTAGEVREERRGTVCRGGVGRRNGEDPYQGHFVSLVQF